MFQIYSPLFVCGGRALAAVSIGAFTILMCLFPFLLPEYPLIPSYLLGASLVTSDSWIGVKNHRSVGKAVTSKCDIYDGFWVYDETYPLWNPKDFLIISKETTCESRGREGQENFRFQKFRWQPYGCDLDSFNASEFRSSMENKRIAFVGDSLARNQFLSLAGMASKGLDASRVSTTPPLMSVASFHGRPVQPSELFHFLDQNFTLEHFSSKFLVRSGRPPKGSPPEVNQVMFLDEVHWFWASAVSQVDVLVFNAGHWLMHQHTYGSARFPLLNGTIVRDMHPDDILRHVTSTLVSWVEKSINREKTTVILRSFAPVHDYTYCPTNSPLQGINSSVTGNFCKVAKELNDGMTQPMIFLNITEMSGLRPDGHIGQMPGKEIDCSHWCTPGVPDAWNELLVAELKRAKASRSQAVIAEAPGSYPGDGDV